MKTSQASPRLILVADTARDLMVPNPISISDKATVKEAIIFLTDKGFHAAPVIDEAGRPVGVVSHTDIVLFDYEKAEYLRPFPEYYDKGDLTTSAKEKLPKGFQVENVDRTLVRDIMTPAVFSVTPDTPVERVVEQMLQLKVHRLFVVDGAGVLVGVITGLGILRHLK